jgi:large-conductance mechanosensitive channel
MIVQFLVSVACILMVASFPIWKTALGAALRRWSCFLFVLAFAPSVFISILQEAVRAREPWSFATIIEEVFTLLIVAAIAYAVLAWRKRAAAEKKPKRLAMKQPVDPPGARPDLLNMLRDQLRNDGGGEEHGE